MKPKTFIFKQKNGSGRFETSAFTFDDAYDNLCDEVNCPRAWKCENEDGEE